MKKGLIIGVCFLFIVLMLSFVSAECTDSDGGKNPAIKGTTSGWNSFDDSSFTTKTDYCYVYGDVVDENLEQCSGEGCGIMEFHCTTGGGSNNLFVGGTFYYCSEGCQDGVCIGTSSEEPEFGMGVSSVSVLTCDDSDGGKDYYIRGEVTYEAVAESTGVASDFQELDFCVNDTILAEQFCNDADGLKEIDYYECPNGCDGGVCLPDYIPKIFLKVNGADSPSPIAFLSKFNVSWTTTTGDFVFCTIGGSNIYLDNKRDTLGSDRVGVNNREGYITLQHRFNNSGEISLLAIVAPGFDLNSLGFQENLTIRVQCATPPEGESGMSLFVTKIVYVPVYSIDEIEIESIDDPSEFSSSTCNKKGICTLYDRGGVNARSHFIFIDSISSFGVILIIDGKVTNTLVEDETLTLEDGSFLTIKSLSSDKVVFTFSSSCFDGCLGKGTCYEIGTRKGLQYCEPSSLEFVFQLPGGLSCIADYQCYSNSCIESICAEPNFFQKFIINIKELF